MRYVNEDIVLRGDEAKQFVYNLHHPNVAKIVEENRRRDKALDEVNYQETDDGFTFELEPLDWANSIETIQKFLSTIEVCNLHSFRSQMNFICLDTSDSFEQQSLTAVDSFSATVSSVESAVSRDDEMLLAG